ncbi:hypothetical protein EJV31_24885, partial [Salmonella enterica]|nr:hypothetical protein [Salmonella enterica]
MSNIASPMPQIRAKFTNKLGIPLSGCKVYTYEPNSNILKTTWLDIDKTTENTNPILLDAAGEADIFLDGLYRIVVKDRFGFVVYDVEKTGNEQPIFNDSLLLTWSGGTQESKNKENISAQDFKAKGDGLANDTQAFTDLEVEYQGQIIDLLGKTYLVTTLPYKNDYINGFFKIGTTTISARGQSRLFGKNTTTPLNLNRDGQLNYSPRYTLTRASGAGSGSVVQSFCIDAVNRYMYTLTATTPPFVCRYTMDGAVATSAQDKTVYSDILGHQGLDVEHIDSDGGTLLWTSAPAGVGAGGKAIAFKYKADPLPLYEYETWTLLETAASESTTPAISADGRYLLCRFQSGAEIRIRIFDMQDIKRSRAAGIYNVSQLYLAEFSVPKVDLGGGESVQSIACDGNYIYILWATFSMDKGDNIIVLDLAGNIIQYFNSHTVGLAESIAIGSSDNQHEPESLCFSKTANGSLTMLYGVSYGSNPSRKFTVYELGGDTPAHVTIKDRPAFLAESLNGMEYCAPTGKPMRFGTYSKESGYREHFRVDYLGRLLKGITADMPIGGTVCGLQWHSESTQANMVLGRWAAGTSQYSQMLFFKSSGTVVGESVANPSGAILGAISFRTDVGTGNSPSNGVISAAITASTSGDVVGGNSPSRLNFSTTSMSGNYTTRWTIDSNGDLLPSLSNNYS